MSEDITVEKVQALLIRAPYHQWLGLQVLAVHDDGIDLKAAWREEWVVNPDRRYTHGGVLAALVDLAADWALVKRTGRGVPTIDLRVDYHAAAMPGDLTKRAASSLPPKRMSMMPGGSCWRAAEAPISPRRLHRPKREFHRRWRSLRISAI